MEIDSSWVERFYTHFLGRDFTYLFSGALFICVVEYALYVDIFLPQLSLELIGFLAASYFLGSVLRDIADEIFSIGDPSLPDNYKSGLVFYQALINKYDNRILDRYERYYNQLATEVSIGGSSFFGGIFMLIVFSIRLFLNMSLPSIYYIVLAISLVSVGIYMLKGGKEWVKFIEEERCFLIEGSVCKNDITKTGE